MSQNYIGEILTVAFNYAPLGTQPCIGQLLAIQQNTALFTLIGTTYGGDGIVTFGLPDLQSRVPIGFGPGRGLSSYVIGQSGGVEDVTLSTGELPAHVHGFTPSGSLSAIQTKATDQAPSDGALLARSVDGVAGSSSLPQVYVPAGTAGSTVALGGLNLAAGTTNPAGGNESHTNIQPYLAINYCIALEGLFPSRN